MTMYTKYHTGDIVMIRPDLVARKLYYMFAFNGETCNGICVNDFMLSYAGRLVEIDKVECGNYRLKTLIGFGLMKCFVKLIKRKNACLIR